MLVTADATSTLSVVALLISGLALLVSGVSVYLLWKQNRAAAMAQFQGSFVAIANVFLDHPELRPLFYEGASGDGLTDDQRQCAEAVAEMLLDIFDLVIELKDEFGMQRLFDGWRPYIDDLLDTSPFLRRFLSANIKWYGSIEAYQATRRATAGA